MVGLGVVRLLAGGCGPAILDTLSARGRVVGIGWPAVVAGLPAGDVVVGDGPVAVCTELFADPVVVGLSGDVPCWWSSWWSVFRP